MASMNQQTYYIVGDVHGYYHKLMKLVSKLPKNARIVFVGDLIDRGPDSAKVVAFVRDNGHLCVRGNHEEYMIKERPEKGWEWNASSLYKMWLKNGGDTTLASYGLTEYETLRLEGKTTDALQTFYDDIEWLDTLPFYLKLRDCSVNGRKVIVTHASVSKLWHERLTNRMNFNAKVTINRDSPSPVDGIYNVIGHTPFRAPNIYEYAARIDTGPYLYGTLSALEVPTLNVVTSE